MINKIISFIVIYSLILTNMRILSGQPYVVTDLVFAFLMILILFKKKNKIFTLDTEIKYPLFVLIYFSLCIFTNYLIYENKIALLSQCRFLFGFCSFIILYKYFAQEDVSSLKYYYCQFIVLSSIFIIIQNISFHFFHYNIFISYGYLDVYENSVAHATAEDAMFNPLRSGGFFREPSWFAIFAFPALNLLYLTKKYWQLSIMILGIILSTSTLGYVFLLCFGIISIFKNKNIKLKLGIIVGGICFILFSILLYLKFPFLFERLIYAFETGGSYHYRVYLPFEEAFNRFSFFGTDPDFLKYTDYVFFVNTLVYLFIISGLFGVILFLPFIVSFKIKYIFYSICFILSLIVEGMAGRMDFWVLILILFLIRYKKMEELDA